MFQKPRYMFNQNILSVTWVPTHHLVQTQDAARQEALVEQRQRTQQKRQP